MKTLITKTLMLAAILIAAVSCATTKTVPQKLDDFVDDAEIHSGNYTMDDWKKSGKEYEALVMEYLEQPDKYSEDEKMLATRAMGRYHALVLKSGLEGASSLLKGIGKILPEYIEGLSEGIKEGSVGLEGLFRDILDTTRLKKSVEDLGSALEGIFGPAE